MVLAHGERDPRPGHQGGLRGAGPVGGQGLLADAALEGNAQNAYITPSVITPTTTARPGFTRDRRVSSFTCTEVSQPLNM
jgi:hypothetical protein